MLLMILVDFQKKMNPPSQQVFLGNQQHPPAAPTIPDGKLWGSNVRRSMGITQIVFGGIEVVLGIAVDNYFYWQIWTGVFAIGAGFLGVFSLKKIRMVIAYMATSIITAVLCGGCFINATLGTLSSSYDYSRASVPVYIMMCIVFFIHMVISIIGASFTCGALSSTTTQFQQVVNSTPQPVYQQYVPTPPYTVN